MSELVATPTRSPVIEGIRRAEAMALAGLAVAVVVSLGAPGALLSFALLATAAVLLPRRRESALSDREEQRLQLARDLLSDGNALRARYQQARRAGLARRGHALMDLRFEIIDWIADSRSKLARYPEFAGIYEAHHGADLVAEMDGRLERLAEIVRLAQASNHLGLKI